MFRQVIACGVAVLFCASVSGAAVRDAAEQALMESTLKQQAVVIPAGSVVEVKYLEKGAKKLVGRLGSVTDAGFEVQVAEKGNITSQQVAFSEVKSLKARKGMHPVAKGAIIGGVAFGVLVAICAIALAAAGSD